MRLLVWLLLYTTTVNICRAACTDPSGEDGDVRVAGTINTALPAIAGRMEICDGMEWRAVCHDRWDLQDAMVVCRQLGFDPQGTIHCRNSCFGENSSLKEFTNIRCTGTETRLIDCTATRNNFNNCQNAGVFCATVPQPAPDCMACPPEDCTTCPQVTPQDCTMCPQTTPSDYPTTSPTLNTTPPLPECAPRQDTPSTQGSTGEEQTATCTAIGGGLGALAAGLALILVGVIMGWVWHCHRSRGKSESFTSPPASPPPLYETPDTIYPTPDYATASLSQPYPSTEPGGGETAPNPNPSYGTTSQPHPSTEPGGGETAPNPSYGTTSQPRPSAEPGSERVCPNPSYATPSCPTQEPHPSTEQGDYVMDTPTDLGLFNS